MQAVSGCRNVSEGVCLRGRRYAHPPKLFSLLHIELCVGLHGVNVTFLNVYVGVMSQILTDDNVIHV